MAAHAERCGADWIGLVFVPESPRHVTLEAAGDILAGLKGRAMPVALLVDPDDKMVEAVIDQLAIRDIQLHGKETPERLAELAARFDARFWKAVGVEDRTDLDRASEFEAAQYLLLDARAPKGATQTGGHGTSFDWTVLEGWSSPRPWILAGGLNPANVADAIAATGASAVDVSSGVESARGIKDETLIESFLAAAKPSCC